MKKKSLPYIAIPSYHRHELLQKVTMNFLKKHEYPPERINIFVADEEEKSKYKETVDPKTYNQIIVGELGICQQRNFIQMWYPEATELIMVDDDIYDIHKLRSRKVASSVTTEELYEFIGMAFEKCQQLGINIWGIYPVLNAYFMKPRVQFDLKYIIANFFGLINTHDPKTFVYEMKEDFERSILFYLRDGALMRFMWMSAVSKYYKEPGGLQDNRTVEMIEKSSKSLAAKYPDLCFAQKEKSGFWEVVFKKQKKLSTSSPQPVGI